MINIENVIKEAETSDFIFDRLGDAYSESFKRKEDTETRTRTLLRIAKELKVGDDVVDLSHFTPQEIVDEFFRRL